MDITRISCCGSRTYNSEQSRTVPIHLCGFQESESAPSGPGTPRAPRRRHSGSTSAEPAIAASTCTQAPCSAAHRQDCRERVYRGRPGRPDAATTAAGRRPASTSARIASRSASGRRASCPDRRRPAAGCRARSRPAAPPSPPSECACARGVDDQRSRLRLQATRLAVVAGPLPGGEQGHQARARGGVLDGAAPARRAPSARPARRTHLLELGQRRADCQRARRAQAREAKSPSTEASDALEGNQPKCAGCCTWVNPARRSGPDRPAASRSDPPPGGGRQEARRPPRRGTWRAPAGSGTRDPVVGDPVDQRVAAARNSSGVMPEP